MKYLLVNNATNCIENIIIIDSIENYTPPNGFSIYEDNGQSMTELYGQYGVVGIYLDPKIAIRTNITQLESASGIPRITREFMLQVMEKEATNIGMSLSQLADANIGYKKLKDLDLQIRALRAQL